MKKIIATLLAVALSVTLCASALAESRLDKILSAGEIHMATSPDFAPSEFIDDSKEGQDMYVGSDIELGKYIASKLGVKLVIDAMDFSAVQASVAMGQTDMAISGFAYTDERAEVAEMSAYYNIDDDGKGQGLLVLKENADKFQTAEDFAGLTIATQNGSLQYTLATTQLPEDIKIELIGDLGTAVLMLINGKVDAIAVAGGNGEVFANNYPEVAMAPFKFFYESEGTVLMVPKGETSSGTTMPPNWPSLWASK